MSNLRHLMNYDDVDDNNNNNNTTSTSYNGINNHNTHKNAFSINNLINGPVPSNTIPSELPKLEYNYATPQQSTIYGSNSVGNQEQSVDAQPTTDEQATPTTTTTTTTTTDRISQEQILSSFERIKTHFPAARIKKIMQSDEEIGKVAQATPIIVGRALEIFMANLVEVSVLQAKKQGVKRITASHVKSAIENTEQFDFLVDAVEKYPSLKN
ncbi:hypothetical protein CANMA_004404 [Candida margitis]|uniref:uncharacterized protein n=1 Tax=Candida margitis TaxID=1775924 RepID=UPI00222760A7|nr:uncharacterized protein CANMA_004404 [Candida margitis]KAI5957400.1 hypothetical protein CANMA_004404 [Candida margitis]